MQINDEIQQILDSLTEHKLCDALPTMVWLSDMNAKLVYCNDECMRFTGISKSQLEDEGFTSCIFPEDLHVFQSMAVQVLTTLEPGSCEIRCKRFDGEYIWYLIRCQLCFQNRLWAGVNINIHDKKILEETQRKLKAENEQKENERLLAVDMVKARMEFFAKMSHELRTPIHGILGSTEIINNLQLNEEMKKWMNIIRLSGENLLTTINDILDFSKIESGKFDLFITDFELIKVIQRVESSLLSMCLIKKIKLEINFPDKFPPWIKGDPDRLSQVLLNFGSNAVKFTPVEGHVTISVSISRITDDKVYTKIAVKDSGIGIAEDKIKNLFNPFVQADSSISKRFGGTGLGLTICKNLVALMNGSVGCNSVHGKGSEFYAEIPFEIASVDMKNIKVVDDEELRKETKSRRWVILLAEDNAVNQMIAEKNLARYGIHVVIAADGSQAFEKFKTIHYDAILMDCHMPVMDGFECSREIRKYEKNNNVVRRIPIIACTASVTKDDIEKCLAAGMDEICPKPFVTQNLVLLLGKVIL